MNSKDSQDSNNIAALEDHPTFTIPYHPMVKTNGNEWNFEYENGIQLIKRNCWGRLCNNWHGAGGKGHGLGSGTKSSE
ncbi:MAG: hypothetical protein H7X84_00860 [Verrucomicrobia bacterium]|nr:hypothetical protein [Prolixibacteraceae bacterium]